MAIANTVIDYLESNRVKYSLINIVPVKTALEAARAATIAPDSLACATLVSGGGDQLMVVIPAGRKLDIWSLARRLKRDFAPSTEQQIQTRFHDCGVRYLPPLGMAYGVPTVVDQTLTELEQVYFMTGDRSHLIQVDKKNFRRVFKNAVVGSQLTLDAAAAPPPMQNNTTRQNVVVSGDDNEAALDIRERLRKTKKLPAMPVMAQRIIQLKARDEPDVRALGNIVELDPSLAAQVMRYASSPFFAYRGKIDSVQTAISRVLGYDMVMNLTFGIATARPFRIPRNCPLGLDTFWRHAVYSAAFTQALSNLLPPLLRPPSGLAYVAGLLHNFGHLLLGHLFRSEFMVLNRIMQKHPDKPLLELEIRVLGTHHGEIGAWLMEAWRLPEELIISAREHHNVAYQGSHAVYPHLVLIVDRLLKRYGIGHSPETDFPEAILEYLEISEYQILSLAKRILESSQDLDAMARQLAA